MALKLDIIICSTRPGRIGPAIAQWVQEQAVSNGKFDSELVDLAAVNLPIYDEPRHPTLQQYEHDHTKRWAAIVSAADAYIFVTPEYNYGPTPAMVNALNYVYKEWNFKPAAFVSYGGVSGGTRAVQMAKQTVSTLKMVPLVDAVVVPLVQQQMAEGKFQPSDPNQQAVTGVLNELFRYANALKVLR